MSTDAELPANDTIKVNRDIHFEQIAEVCKIKHRASACTQSAISHKISYLVLQKVIRFACLRQLSAHLLMLKIPVYNYKVDELFTKRKEVRRLVEPVEVSSPHVIATAAIVVKGVAEEGKRALQVECNDQIGTDSV